MNVLADAVEAGSSGAWGVVLAGILMIPTVAKRLVAWGRAHRALLLLVFDLIQQFRNAVLPDVSVEGLVGEIDKATKYKGGELRDLADKLAIAVEAVPGKAAKKREDTKGRRFLRGLAKWAPLLGALL